MLIGVEEVMELTGAPKSSCYALIKTLNEELKQQGYLTLRGRVEKRYLLERFRIVDEIPGGI